jgi:hypothetical protein
MSGGGEDGEPRKRVNGQELMKKFVVAACALALLAVIVPRALDLVSLATFVADFLSRAYQRHSGWSRWYLLIATLCGSWILARLTSPAVSQLKRVAEGPSAFSAAIEIAVMIPVFIVGGVIVAAAAGAAWPLTLTYVALRRGQRAARRERAERLEADSLRDEIARVDSEQS